MVKNCIILLQSGIPVWQWLPVYPFRQLHVKLLMPSTQEPPFWQVWLTQSLMSVKVRRLNLFSYKTEQQIKEILAAVLTTTAKSKLTVWRRASSSLKVKCKTWYLFFRNSPRPKKILLKRDSGESSRRNNVRAKYANSPGYSTDLPLSRTSHQISPIKSTFEYFCAHFFFQNSTVPGAFLLVFSHWQWLFCRDNDGM